VRCEPNGTAGKVEVVFALLRKTKLIEPGAAEEAARRIRDGLVPILKERPGFRLHLGFVSEACETVGLTLYDDRDPALDAYQCVRGWVTVNMRDLTPDEPEVRLGAVLLDRGIVRPVFGGEAALFVTMRQYVCLWAAEEAIPLLTERILPLIGRQPGFQAFWAFRDEYDAAHVISVSVWSGRGSAFAAHERVLEITEPLCSMFSTSPKVTAGAARLLVAE
jgi:hypothetical protein